MSLQHAYCYDTCRLFHNSNKNLQYFFSPSLKLVLNLLFITFVLFCFLFLEDALPENVNLSSFNSFKLASLSIIFFCPLAGP